MSKADECRDGGLIKQRLREFASEFDPWFAALLSPSADVSTELMEVMRYAALAPGKRLRPYLCARCCALAGGDEKGAWFAGAAIECVHAFSLIHDDLPAMDDDDMRRGQPTCHKQFGEAMAILAGDGLSVLAFEILTTHAPAPVMAARMVSILASCGGWEGMIGGQAADVAGESQPASLDLVEYIHARKTARLFQAACAIGAIAGEGSEESINALADYGSLVGRAFQIGDDLLDVTGSSHELGKTAGKDAKTGKQTFPRCVGNEESRKRAQALAETAATRLRSFGAEADDLRELAAFAVERDY